MYLTGSHRYLRLPVLQSLHLVHNQYFRFQRTPHLNVVRHTVVWYYLIGNIARILLLTLHGITFYDKRQRTVKRAVLVLRKAFYLALPLIFQRSWTDYQYLLGQPLFPKQFRRSNSLDSLTQAHFVSNNRTPFLKSKTNAFFLIGIQRYCKQIIKPLISIFLNQLATEFLLSLFQYKVNGILIETERRINLWSLYQ